MRAGIEPPAPAPRPLTLDPILEAVEKRLIQLALQRADNHQTEAAEMLGIFRAVVAAAGGARHSRSINAGETPEEQ